MLLLQIIHECVLFNNPNCNTDGKFQNQNRLYFIWEGSKKIAQNLYESWHRYIEYNSKTNTVTEEAHTFTKPIQDNLMTCECR